MQLGQYALREVINTQFFTVDGSTPLLYFDFPNSVSWDMSADIVYATGGVGGPRRASFAGNKNGTLTIESQIFTLSSLAIMTGSEVLKGQTDIFEVENTVVKNSGGLTVSLSKTPVAATVTVFKFVNGVITDKAVVTGIVDKDVELAPGVVVEGDEVQVFYQWKTTSDSYTIQIDSDKFPPYIMVIGEAFFTDTLASEAIVDGQFVFHKAKSQPTYTLTGANSGDPTSISMVLDLFNAPQSNGRQAMVDLTLYDE